MRQQRLWDADDRAVARATDPPTSWDAARSQSIERITVGQSSVLNCLNRNGPMTDEEIYSYWRVSQNLSPSGARTRRAELVAKGLVEDSGKRRLTGSGRKSIVWKAT